MRHHEPARALDHQQPVVGWRTELLHVDGDAGPPRRLVRRHGFGQKIGLGQDAAHGAARSDGCTVAESVVGMVPACTGFQ